MSAQSDPTGRCETIDISLANHAMTKCPVCRGLYVGGGGTVVVTMHGDGASQTFVDVPAGTILPVMATAVVRNGTTATSIVALF